MNRTDRMLAIVLELQAHGRRRAEDLAATFETSKRTIYRDLQALSEAGVPLVAIPGLGYSLMEGYFLPPLSFSAGEATMLLLGSDVMAESFDASFRAAAQMASRKITQVLPAALRAEVQSLQESIHFLTVGVGSKSGERLLPLRQAIVECRAVRFGYYARHRSAGRIDTPISRDVDPYALAHVGEAWYLTGFDHLRQEIRTFRLDRMEGLIPLDRTFTRPTGFRLRREPVEDHAIQVRALFAPEVARWVREARSFFVVAEEEVEDGLLLTLRIRQESELVPWLLSWGQQVRVLEPASLRRRLYQEATAMLALHRDLEMSVREISETL